MYAQRISDHVVDYQLIFWSQQDKRIIFQSQFKEGTELLNFCPFSCP